MTQEERYESARKRVKTLRDFYIHLATYVFVMIVLFIIDYSDRGTWWVYWPAMGWGIALVLNAFQVFGPGERWEQRKIKELMEREAQDDVDAPMR